MTQAALGLRIGTAQPPKPGPGYSDAVSERCPSGPRRRLAGAVCRPFGLCPCGRLNPARVLSLGPERCPSGLRSATGNRVRAERSVAGSNPALSARGPGNRALLLGNRDLLVHPRFLVARDRAVEVVATALQLGRERRAAPGRDARGCLLAARAGDRQVVGDLAVVRDGERICAGREALLRQLDL